MLSSEMPATPILDLEQSPPQPSKSWFPKLIGVVLGVFLGLLLILNDQNRLPQWHWPAMNGFLLIPALYVVIAIHEIGHFVAGRIVGFEMGAFSVGAFVFTKSGNNWVFRFDRRKWVGGFYTPLNGIARFNTARCAWMVLGGPLASILLTVLCGEIFARYGSGYWAWIGSLCWTSLFILIISAVPFSAGLNKSDSARLWQLIRHPQRARSWMALLAIQAEDAGGLRPREWNSQQFEEILLVDSSAREYLYCQLMAFYRRLDEGSDAVALAHLENALARSAQSGKEWRHVLFLEAASASASIRKHAAQARTWRDRACKLRRPESLDVVEAEIAMCEGRHEEALHHWGAAMDRILRQRLDSGLIRFAKEKWADSEAACRVALG